MTKTTTTEAPRYADADQYDENGDRIDQNGAAVRRLLADRVVDGAWLDEQDFPPLHWTVPGLVPEGFGLLTGSPKVGKSWLSLDLCLAVATGGRALQHVRVGPARPVLLLALEDGHRRLQARARDLLAGEAIPANLNVIITAQPAEVPLLIEAWLTAHSGSNPLVVLDTLGRILPAAIQGETQYQRDYRVAATLKRLADAHPGSTVLCVHHTRKMTATDWMDTTSGTQGLNGAADFTISVSRERNSEEAVLRVTGRDVPEGEYAVIVGSGKLWTLDGNNLTDAATSVRTRRVSEGLGERSVEILHLVAEHPEGIGPTEVALAVGMEAKHAGEYLRRLHEAGRILKLGRGKYFPAAPLVPPVESVGCVESEGAEVSTVTTVSTHVEDTSPPCTECGRPIGGLREAYGKTTCVECERSTTS
ncbi:hypothetical protein GCM10027053_46390 [Intrasporangium mesophilum]